MNIAEANSLLNLSDTCQVENNDTIAFLGMHSIYSNFYPSEFRLENKTYNSAEQMIQAEKAALFDDDIALSKILAESNPYKIKKIGSRIGNYDERKWNQKSKEAAYRAVYAKFSQNATLRSALLNNNKLLVEGSREPVWGTGVHLHDKNALDPRFWTDGPGLMSDIYSKVKDELSK